ncbi:uncharacterized protein LOC110863401 [Folsomia candida]|uniref:Retinitis pigmentosa 1-like 1 protein n=1 Tax=Folsomia candida TaxID=158441 RepID=A0A226F4B3_FOLCA|nr:uncharacterized protein LOC110863401 [Folsomia candida]OXA64298.1 Retinitis pigmentosa 1-like 1 protein [Folsomia candida]
MSRSQHPDKGGPSSSSSSSSKKKGASSQESKKVEPPKKKEVSSQESKKVEPQKKEGASSQESKKVEPPKKEGASSQESKKVEPQKKKEVSSQESKKVEPQKKEGASSQESKKVEPQKKEGASSQESKKVEPQKKKEVSSQESKKVEPQKKEGASSQESKKVEPQKKEGASSQESKKMEPPKNEGASCSQESKKVEPPKKKETSSQESKPVEPPKNEGASFQETKKVEPPRNEGASSQESKKVEPPRNEGASSQESKKVEPPKNEFTLPKMEEELDLLDYVLRAIGVLQAIQHIGNVRFLQTNQDAYNNKIDVLLNLEPIGSRIVKYSDLPKKLWEDYRIVKIYTDDFISLGGSTNPLIPLPPPEKWKAVKIYDTIRTMWSFMQVWNLKDEARQDYQASSFLDLPIMSTELREAVYWVLTFIDKSRSLIAGILESAAALEKAGVKYWVLPNRQRVPVGSLRATIFETVPSYVFSVSMQIYNDKEKFDKAKGMPYMGVGGVVRRNHVATLVNTKEKGKQLVIRHHVLSALLPDGSAYIVDPTGRMFGYRGSGGSLIIHGSEEYYRTCFPGKVTDEPMELMGVKKYMRRFRDEPDAAFIPELKRYLVKWIDKSVCSYCGLIGDIHPIEITLCNDGAQPHLKVESTICDVEGCGGCGLVGYCCNYCQNTDWPRHKSKCTKPWPPEGGPPPRGGPLLPRGQQPPPEGEQPPPQGEKPQPEGEQPPPQGEQPPPKGEQPPPQGEQTPPQEEQPPPQGEQTPTRGKQTPSRGQQTPSRGKQTPSRGQQTPSRGKQTPSRGQQTPSRGKQTPSRGKQTPPRGK